jgi:hypothetical protein
VKLYHRARPRNKEPVPSQPTQYRGAPQTPEDTHRMFGNRHMTGTQKWESPRLVFIRSRPGKGLPSMVINLMGGPLVGCAYTNPSTVPPGQQDPWLSLRTVCLTTSRASGTRYSRESWNVTCNVKLLGLLKQVAEPHPRISNSVGMGLSWESKQVSKWCPCCRSREPALKTTGLCHSR